MSREEGSLVDNIKNYVKSAISSFIIIIIYFSTLLRGLSHLSEASYQTSPGLVLLRSLGFPIVCTIHLP